MDSLSPLRLRSDPKEMGLVIKVSGAIEKGFYSSRERPRKLAEGRIERLRARGD